MTKNRPYARIRMTKMNDADIVIIGGGPAGLSAAVWCSDLHASVILVEKEGDIGGQLRNIYNPINNYLGRTAANGAEMLLHFRESIEHYKFLRRVNEEVIAIDTKSGSVQLGSGDVIRYGSLIIATGVRRRPLNIPGEFEFRGKGVHESGARDKENMAGKHVLVIGGGDAAVENALIISEHAASVKLVHRRSSLTARNEFLVELERRDNIETIFDSVITRIVGETAVSGAELRNIVSGVVRVLDFDAVLIRIGFEPNSELVRGILDLDSLGFIEVNAECETSVDGVYAVGDVANPVSPTLSTATGTGSIAAKASQQKIKSRTDAL